jgi:hypothetical protein
MVIRGLYILIVLCILVPSLVSGFGIKNDNSSIVLEREMCFGYCPVYILILSGNGSVIYDGGIYVKETGIRNGSINEKQYSALWDLAERNGFFTMKD